MEAEQIDQHPDEVKPKRKPKAIAVSVMQATKETALVRWVEKGQLYAGYIPSAEILDGKVSDEVLAMAAPYGIRWEALIDGKGIADRIASALRDANVWTLEDLKVRGREVQRAIQRVATEACRDMVREVKE